MWNITQVTTYSKKFALFTWPAGIVLSSLNILSIICLNFYHGKKVKKSPPWVSNRSGIGLHWPSKVVRIRYTFRKFWLKNQFGYTVNCWSRWRSTWGTASEAGSPDSLSPPTWWAPPTWSGGLSCSPPGWRPRWPPSWICFSTNKKYKNENLQKTDIIIIRH